MTTLLCVLLAVLTVIVMAIVIIRVSSKPKPPQDSQAGKTPNGKTDWGKEWEKWKEKIAIPLSVIAFGAIWWLNEPNSFSKAAHSKMFWSGVFLVVVLWGYFLTLPKTFKENFSRKIFMLIAFPVGIVMMFISFVPVEKVRAEIFSASAAPISTPQHRTILQTGPNNWTLVNQLPSRTDFTIDYPGDWLEYKLHDGRRIRHENTTGKKYLIDIKGNAVGPPPTFPGRTFYIQTEKIGQTTITW